MIHKLDSLLFIFFPGGLKAILTDQNKLVVAVGGVTALAAGIYTTRLDVIIVILFEFYIY